MGFPFIFRGALDVNARKINEEMKLAAVKAVADLAKEEVPEEVKLAYGNEDFSFGPNYIIPKPFDSKSSHHCNSCRCKSSNGIRSCEKRDIDLNEYAANLQNRLGTTASFMKSLRDRLSAFVKREIKGSHGFC